jgi:hypothetical protein
MLRRSWGSCIGNIRSGDSAWVVWFGLQGKSLLKTEEACGVMDCNDMDLFTNDSVYDSIGALDHFAHGLVIDLRNDTARLGECGQAFNGRDQSLSNKLGIVGRVLSDKLPDGLNIVDCSAGPDQLGHLRI